jgi:hypothetical protein
MATPAVGTTAVQESPTPATADDIKLKPTIDVASPSLEPQKVDPPPATASRPSHSVKPAAKRTAAAPQHSTAAGEKPHVAYPGYGAPM